MEFFIIHSNTESLKEVVMTERDFELLDVLAETANITKAADRLYMTQSSLSKRIVILEEELGVTLLLRSRQGIRFTPEGEIVLNHARKAMEIMDAMREEMLAKKAVISGTLNAGVSINYAQYRLPSLLASYRKRYPYVKTHILSGHSRDQYLKILNGTLDVAILRGDFLWNEHRILLSREPVCAIMNKEYESVDLDQIPFIGRKTDGGFERDLTRWFRESNLQISTSGIVVDNISTCVEMVKNGLGWSVLPEICLRDYSGIVRPLSFADGEPFVRSTYLLYTDQAAQLQQVKAFVDLVKEENHV